MKREGAPTRPKTRGMTVNVSRDGGTGRPGRTECGKADRSARTLRALPVGVAVYASFAVVALVPLLARNYYYLRAGGAVGLYLILALGLNIVAGEAGLLDLGYVAFYGIGAYVYALLSSPHFGLNAPFLLSTVCSVLAAVCAAMLVSLPTLHLRGDYLAMVTLGFGQIVRILLNNLDRPVNITNGPNGIIGVNAPSIFGVSFASLEMSYVLIWVIAAGVASVVSRVIRSKTGRAWAAIREDEVAAACMGVDVARYRVMAFSWGAGLAGLAGALFASWQRAVFPQNFTMTETIAVYCMIILGGMRSIPGAMVGTLVLVILPELLRAYSVYRMLIYGVALVLLVVYRPQGLLPAGSTIRLPAIRRRRASRGAPEIQGSAGTAKAPSPGTPEHGPTHVPSMTDDVAASVAQAPVWGLQPNLQPRGDSIALEVESLICRFGGLEAVSDISFTVRQGEVLGIIGPNGAGKTTLFNLVTGITKPSSGDIRVFGVSISSMPPHKIAALGIARTFQNIRLFDSRGVLENVLAGCHLRLPGDLPGVILRTAAFRARETSEIARAKGAMSFFGPELAARGNAPVNSLTYPDRRRVELARALAAGPHILLLDEPTAGMTPEEAGDVVEEIRLLKESGYTVLVIEHHMDVVADTCDRVIALDHGEKIAEGTPAEVASNPEVMQAYLGTPTASGGAAESVADRLVGHAGSERRIATRQRNVATRQEGSDTLSPESVLELEGVHSSYGAVRALQGVDLQVNSEEIVVVLGSNAAGKSTMLKTILGGVRPSSGSIVFMGRRIDALPTSEIARAGIAIVPEGRRIFPGLTVLENLELGGYVLQDRHAIAESIDRIFDLFPALAERRGQRAGTLSGGEQQMLAISRALVASPKLICMDEPSMGLAPILVDRVMQAIQDINRAGMTVLLVEQNARAALAIADRAYILRSGRVVASGAASDFLGDERVARAYLS